MFLYKIESKLIISRSRTVWKIERRSFKKLFLFSSSPNILRFLHQIFPLGKRKLQIRNWRLKTNRRNANSRYYFSYFWKIFSLIWSFHSSLILSVAGLCWCLCQWYLSSGSEILKSRIKFCQNAIHSGPEVAVLCTLL